MSETPAAASAVSPLVTFVGAGPGNPELLTLAAVAAINDAAAIICDYEGLRSIFAHPAITIDETVSIGAMGNPRVAHLGATCEQRLERIEAAINEHGSVLRLVEGDPFMDGGAVAEAAACVQAGYRIEVVPGVSGSIAIPEYAGVALASGSGVQFISALVTEDCFAHPEHWTTGGTIVASVRANQMNKLVEAARASGRADTVSVLATARGGSKAQVSVSTTLDKLEKSLAKADLAHDDHVYVMVGAEIDYHRKYLDWYESKPLFGWRVLIPTTKEASTNVVERLNHYGARSQEVPTLSVEPPRTPQPMRRAMRGLAEGEYEWVAFTSSSAVRAVREQLDEYGLDARALSGLKVAAVGDDTKEALQTWGITPELMPVGTQTTAALLAVFPAYDSETHPINGVFLPRADIATETLAAGLTKLGWEADSVIAFRTVRAAPPPPEVREAIKTGEFDAVVFTSSTAVRNLVGIAGKPHKATIVAAIGPATVETCSEHGLEVAVVADNPTGPEVVRALAQYARHRHQELVAAGKAPLRPSRMRRRRRAKSQAGTLTS